MVISIPTTAISLPPARLEKRWSGSVYGDFYRTDGYPIVKNRGPGRQACRLRIQQWRPQANLETLCSTLRVHGGQLLLEGRDSGTNKTNNDWWFGDGAAGVDYQTEGGSHWQFRLFGGGEQFSNNNSSINAARTTEVRTLHQDIPVQNVGGSVVWWRPLGEKNLLSLGFDNRFITADNKEKTYSATTGLFTGATERWRQSGAYRVFWRVALDAGGTARRHCRA